MNVLKKFLFILSLIFAGSLYSVEVKKDYKIGVLSFNNKAQTHNLWDATAKYLSNKVSNSNFSIIPMFYDELDNAIANKQVDFVLTNSGHYVVHQKNSNLFRLVTIVKNEQDNFVSEFGGVIVTLATRSDINKIEDLKNKKIAAVGKSSLGAYQAQTKELIDADISYKEKNFIFTGLPQEKALSLLFEDKADVAFVRTGILEELSRNNKLDLSKLKVINQVTDTKYPFLLSTKLYPEWPFSSMPYIDNITIKEVASALMSMQSSDDAALKGEYYGWSTPQEYKVVRDLLSSLNLPPYEKKLDFTLNDISVKYSDYILVLMAVGFVFTFYLIFITIRLYKTKQQLEINQNKLKLAASVYTNSQNGVMITDENGIVEEVNDSFCQITGYTKDEMIGQNASILKSGRHDDDFYKTMWLDINKKGYHKCEIYNAKKTGEIFPCILGISTLKDNKGKTKHLSHLQIPTNTP